MKAFENGDAWLLVMISDKKDVIWIYWYSFSFALPPHHSCKQHHLQSFQQTKSKWWSIRLVVIRFLRGLCVPSPYAYLLRIYFPFTLRKLTMTIFHRPRYEAGTMPCCDRHGAREKKSRPRPISPHSIIPLKVKWWISISGSRLFHRTRSVRLQLIRPRCHFACRSVKQRAQGQGILIRKDVKIILLHPLSGGGMMGTERGGWGNPRPLKQSGGPST